MESINNHRKIALQLSGGKDSVACLYLLKEHLDKITVYHLNTGDQPRETSEIIAKCREIIPNYVEVKTDSIKWIKEHGYPSDVVPTNSSILGRMMGFGTLHLSDRFDCCYSNLMNPMQERMKEDGITLVIRGQKNCDMPKVPFISGTIYEGVEYLYPLQEWSHDDVYKYLKEADAPIHPVYDKINDGIECIHCTGWWHSKHLDWLNDAYPIEAKWVKQKHIEIKIAVAEQMQHLNEV